MLYELTDIFFHDHYRERVDAVTNEFRQFGYQRVGGLMNGTLRYVKILSPDTCSIVTFDLPKLLLLVSDQEFYQEYKHRIKRFVERRETYETLHDHKKSC